MICVISDSAGLVTTDADCLTTGKAVLSRDVTTGEVDVAVQL